jgi:hypothetical protein
MAGEVNELSMILGELRAHNQTAKETSAKLFDKIEGVEGRLTNIENLKVRVTAVEETVCKHVDKIEGVEGRLTNIENLKVRVTAVEETVCKHGGRLDEVDQVKHKAIGAAWLGGIAAGIVGWFIK